MLDFYYPLLLHQCMLSYAKQTHPSKSQLLVVDKIKSLTTDSLNKTQMSMLAN